MKKILIAEDDTFLANAYKIRLLKAGFDIKIAGDGSELLDILNDFTPDIILLDLVMPKMDGFSALHKIKENEDVKNIPVLITSNLGQAEDIKRGMSMGATDYIVKSDLSLEDLVEKINRILSLKN